MSLDMPSDTPPDLQGLAREPHVLRTHCPKPAFGEHSILLDIDESIACTWGERGIFSGDITASTREPSDLFHSATWRYLSDRVPPD
jgi:hypothetical protein